jgi:hypothetical protein
MTLVRVASKVALAKSTGYRLHGEDFGPAGIVVGHYHQLRCEVCGVVVRSYVIPPRCPNPSCRYNQ